MPRRMGIGGEYAEIRFLATYGWPQATLGPVHRGGRATVCRFACCERVL